MTRSYFKALSWAIFGAWQRPEGNRILIAAARYLAAHAPTQRAQLQTARIALRLDRGDSLYEEE